MPTLNLVNPNGSWINFSAGTPNPNKYRRNAGYCGLALAALAWGGKDQNGTGGYTFEKFNGSGWTSQPDFPAYLDYGPQGIGTATAGLSVGGNANGAIQGVYAYNGSSWSSASAGAQLPSGRREHAAFGAQNSAVIVGGYSATLGPTKTGFKFNGTSWSSIAQIGQTAENCAGVGTLTLGMVTATGAGGFQGVAKRVELYNGTNDSWSVGASLNSIKYGGNRTVGTTSSAICVHETYVEIYNGTSWASAAFMGGNNRDGGMFVGTSSDAFYWGGLAQTGGSYPSSPVRWSSGGSGPVSLSVAEGVLANGNIATLSASEAGMTFTLAAGSGDSDNASFQISGSNLNTLSALDYETKNSYSIRINATNGTTTYQNEVSISVTNVNETPSNITLSASSIQENNAVNAVIGTLSAIDPDTGDTSFTFSIAGGADAASFNISGNSLRASEAFNYEAKSSYSVDITATDAGGLTYTKSFSISVTNDTSDDSITVPSSTVLTSGRVFVISASNPTSIPFLLNGSALPVGSVVRWTGNNNQKFLKKSGSSTLFAAILLSVPAEWNWDANGVNAWETLKNI